MICDYCGDTIEENEKRTYFYREPSFITSDRIGALCWTCCDIPSLRNANIISEQEYLLRRVMQS